MTEQTAGGVPLPQAPHNVVATYPSVEAARKALTVLERKGIEAGDISLFGEGVDEVGWPETNQGQQAVDLATSGQVGRRAVSGLALGAFLGALVGGLAAAVVLALLGRDVSSGVVMAAVAGGAAFGAFAGGFYGGASRLPVSEAWSHTFEAVRGGDACVAVHSQHARNVERATEALRGTGAARVVRFGADGRRTDVA